MSHLRTALIAALVVLASSVAPSATRAAEPLTVLCAGAASTEIEQIARDFERTRGRTVVVTEGTAGQVSAKLAAGASAGIYFAGLLQKMGIADAVRPKETLVPGGFSCDLVASGKAALCVQNLSEIVPVHGVVVAGSFPAEVQNYITYAIAVAKNSTSPDDARAFIADAASPSRASLWKSAGFEP